MRTRIRRLARLATLLAVSEIGAEVVEAQLDLTEGTDPAAVGATVSDELCGSWDHDGPCRWPHRNEIDAATAPARYRTVVPRATA